MASSSKSLNIYAPASSAYPYTIGVSFNENSTSVGDNTSSVTVTGTMYAKNIRWSQTANNTLALYWYDNCSYSSGKLIGTINISTFTKNYTYTISDTISVPHNSDGSLKGYAKLVFTKNVTNNYAPPTTNLSTDNIDLTTIPRASTMSFGTGYVEEALYIGINRNSTSFTHKITYNFGSLSGTVTSSAGDSCSWTIPSTFYNQIGASSTYKTGTLSLETYNGSTKIGDTKSYTLTVYCRESKCIPTLTGTIIDSNSTTTNVTGSNKTLVDYMSTAKITLSYTAKNGASISKIYINDVEKTVQSTHTFTPNSSSYVVRVVDSRGYSKSVTFSTSSSGDYYFNRIEYIPLSFTAKTTRPTQTGSSMQVSIDGKFYNGSFGSVTNALTITWKYRIQGASSWTTGSTSIALTKSGNTFYVTNKTIGSSWNYQKVYEFEYTIKDKLMSATYNCTVPKGTASFIVFEDGIMLNGVFLAVETVENW